jgi:LCP family protein required for cell wall assembly
MQRTPTFLVGVAVLVIGAVVAFVVLSTPGDAPGVSPSPVPTAAHPSPSSEESFAAELLERRWTVLFVGTDLNAAREQRGDPVNADAIMIVSLSADQSELVLVSLPRDTVDVPLPAGQTWERKVNALYREEGIDALVDAMALLFGVPIDAHVAMDMDDFSRLVAAVGTIRVSPEEPLEDPIVDLDLEAGPQEIDDRTAQAYVRTRVDQDYGRMGRQQEVLIGIVERLVDPGTDVDLRVVLESLASLETDLPLDELPTLLELARRATDAEVRRMLVEPPLITFEGDRGDGRGYILEPDVEAIRAEVRSLIPD